MHGLVLDLRTALHREHRGAAELQRQPLRGHRREGLAHALDRVGLAVEVGAGGVRGEQQQSARRRAGDPHALLAARRAGRDQRFGDALHLAGRVALEQRLDGIAGRRAEQRQRLVDRVAQPRDAEALRSHRRTELVAVLDQPGARGGPFAGARAAVAVLHLVEAAAVAQGCGQCARRLGPLHRIAAVDADQQRARRHAVLQLLDQHALPCVGTGRQEGRQVGAEAGAGDQHTTHQHAGEPQHQHEPAALVQPRRGAPRHGRTGAEAAVPAGSASMLITERSPPTSSISMLYSTPC